MTEITIRDYTTEGSLAYYTIEKGKWIYDGYASTLDGAFEMIIVNLEFAYQMDNEDAILS